MELNRPRSVRTLHKTNTWLKRSGPRPAPRLSPVARSAALPTRSSNGRRGGPTGRPAPNARPRHLLRSVAPSREAGKDSVARRSSRQDQRALSEGRPINPGDAARAVFQVLEKHVTAGEISDVIQALPQDLRALWRRPVQHTRFQSRQLSQRSPDADQYLKTMIRLVNHDFRDVESRCSSVQLRLRSSRRVRRWPRRLPSSAARLTLNQLCTVPLHRSRDSKPAQDRATIPNAASALPVETFRGSRRGHLYPSSDNVGLPARS